MSNEYNDRFSMNKGEVEFLNEYGEVITSIEEHINKIKQEMLTITEKLNIDDVVELKKTGQMVVIKHVNYKLNDIIKSDYAGILFNSENKNLILFAQEDIEKVYPKDVVEEAQRIIRQQNLSKNIIK